MATKKKKPKNANVHSTTPISVNISRTVAHTDDFYEIQDGVDTVFEKTEVRRMHEQARSKSVVFVHRMTGETNQQICKKIDGCFA